MLFCADLSFCARSATAEALSGVLKDRPITSVVLSVLAAAALVTVSSSEQGLLLIFRKPSDGELRLEKPCHENYHN